MRKLTYGGYAEFLKTIGHTPSKMGRFDSEEKKIVECSLDDLPTILYGPRHEIIYSVEGKSFLHCLEIDLRRRVCDFSTIHGINDDGSLQCCIHEHYFTQFMDWLKLNHFDKWKNVCIDILEYDINRLQKQIEAKEQKIADLGNAYCVEDIDTNERVF